MNDLTPQQQQVMDLLSQHTGFVHVSEEHERTLSKTMKVTRRSIAAHMKICPLCRQDLSRERTFEVKFDWQDNEFFYAEINGRHINNWYEALEYLTVNLSDELQVES